MDFVRGLLLARERRRELERRLTELALASCVHVLIAPEPGIAARLFSASGTLIDFSGRPCLVINKHVLDTYRDESEIRPTLFEFAGIRIDPLPRLYSEDAEADLAVIRLDGLRIRVDREVAAGIPRVELYSRPDWPPPPPAVGDRVFFAGWPEVGRQVDLAEREATFQPYSWSGHEIRSVSDDQFAIRFERERFFGVMGWETDEQLQERDLSGLSGSPIFRDNGVSGRLVPDLIGFVKQYSPEYDYLVATSALNIRADGIVEFYNP